MGTGEKTKNWFNSIGNNLVKVPKTINLDSSDTSLVDATSPGDPTQSSDNVSNSIEINQPSEENQPVKTTEIATSDETGPNISKNEGETKKKLPPVHKRSNPSTRESPSRTRLPIKKVVIQPLHF